MNRLHLTEITSIGAVEEGQADNPESEILIFKSGTPHPSGVSGTAGGRGRSGSGRSLPAADRLQLVARVRLDQQDEQIAAIAKTNEETRRTINQMRAMKGRAPMAKRETGRSSASILAEVDRLANSIQKSAGGTTKAAAKAEVWRANPTWQVEVRKAQARERDQGKELSARIDRIIKSYALSISAEPENMAKTLSQIKNDLAHTAVGIEIKKLRADAMAGKVASETDIRKSDEHADAWRVLKSWEG